MRLSAPILPVVWMRIVLRKREKRRAYLEHAKCLEKLVNANLRVFFLERCLNYSSDDAPDIERSTLKLLLKLAVTNVHFKRNNKRYCQIDSLAMGASLAVILANIWMKSFEDRLKEERCVQEQGLKKDPSDKCPDCSRKLVWNSKGVECERCKNWFHAKCQKISNEEYLKMGDIVWFCSHCCQLPEKRFNV